MNNSQSILPNLFESLERSRISYVVLRGFYNLPYIYSNDIDFGVLKDDVDNFIDILISTGEKYSYILDIRDLRLDVLKLRLSSTKDTIDIDIWSSFNYAGLIYINNNIIINGYKYHNNIKVLKPENELVLSYLKELLHMSRLRQDKVLGLKEKLNSPYRNPFENYFSPALVDKFVSSIEHEEFDLIYLAMCAKISLLKNNISSRGIWTTLCSIINFTIVRLNRRKLIKKMENSFST